MVRISFVTSLCLVFLVIAVSSDESARKPKKHHVDILFIKDIKEFLKEHGAKAIQVLTPQKIISNNGFNGRASNTFVYTAGKHLTGDRVIAGGFKTQSFDYARSISETISFPDTAPSSNSGPIVNYFEIVVTQTSTSRNCYITSGGIGQNKITIVVEIGSSTDYSISATLYGYGY